MKKITIVGVGKIGTIVAFFLLRSKNYHVQLLDQEFCGTDCQRLFQLFPHLDLDVKSIDITNKKSLEQNLNKFKPDAVISCLPFFLNRMIAETAKKINCHYFDLTEDTATTAYIKEIARGAKSAFVPQCGLAPGMVGIIANDLIKQFTEVETVILRVGALPQFSNHPLKYALNWSTDGLINEYDRPCETIQAGKNVTVAPLEELESVGIIGEQYEAFNTSGGLGNLVDLYLNKVQNMNYKTIRYPGHCEKIKFLMQDLKLRENKPLLKQILENAIPRNYQDFVILLVQVIGKQEGKLQSKQYVKKIFPEEIQEFNWAAIQISTAAGVCAVAEVILNSKNKPRGFVYQEKIPFEEILKTPFGVYYQLT